MAPQVFLNLFRFTIIRRYFHFTSIGQSSYGCQINPKTNFELHPIAITDKKLIKRSSVMLKTPKINRCMYLFNPTGKVWSLS